MFGIFLILTTKSSVLARKGMNECWESIVRQLNFDLHGNAVHYVKARQIKEIANKEPRLMAKIDTKEYLPVIFREYDRFILPVSRNEYAIPKGVGYHVLEKPTNRPVVHHTQLPFPDSALRTESESVFLDYANSCGLLKKFTGEENLILTLHGRTTTPNFGFYVNSLYLVVNHAQIEIDACYESPGQIVLFEAKLGIPMSFSLRQLYYPFRAFYGNKKKLRCIFFCLEPKEKIYSFWEYEFSLMISWILSDFYI